MRKPAKTFEDLVVWRKAHQFVLTVYRGYQRPTLNIQLPTSK